MRVGFDVSTVFALVLLLASTACKTPHHMNDTKSLQGSWTCVSAIVDGKPLPPATVQLLRLTLTADRYKTEKGTDVLFDSTYRIDVSKHPAEISMTGTEGDLAGKEALGIYSLDGNSLQICYTMPGDPRPTSFGSAPGSKAYFITWKR
jgi:uncharacterized protein (TIGR03067 family)